MHPGHNWNGLASQTTWYRGGEHTHDETAMSICLHSVHLKAWNHLALTHHALRRNTYSIAELPSRLPKTTMSMPCALLQSLHLLSRAVTPVPLTQLPQRNPFESGRGTFQASERVRFLEQSWYNNNYVHIMLQVVHHYYNKNNMQYNSKCLVLPI